MLYGLSVTELGGLYTGFVLKPLRPGYETLTVNFAFSMPPDARLLAVRLARVAAGTPSSAAFDI